MRKLLIGIVTLGLVAATSAGAATIEKDLPLRAGEQLVIDLGTGGSIVMVGGGGGLSVVAETSGRDADLLRVDIESTSTGARISSEMEGRHRNARAGLDLELTIPSDIEVSVQTMGGSVEVRDARIDLDGKTMGGGVTLSFVEGALSFTTMGGNVTLEDCRLEGKIKTMGGNMTISNASGGLEATTMGGNVEVRSAADGIRLKTMGGNVRIEDTDGDVEVETMGGGMRLSGISGGVRATTMGGDVTAALEASGSAREVHLESMGGDIEVTIPDGMSMEVDVEIEYTKDSRRSFEIVSDFPLAQEHSPEWERSGGQSRKTIRGTATVGSGASTVTVRTVNGDVHLIKGR